MVGWPFIQERTTRDGGISGMSMKMQVDINLLQAHYALLEQRLEDHLLIEKNFHDLTLMWMTRLRRLGKK